MGRNGGRERAVQCSSVDQQIAFIEAEVRPASRGRPTAAARRGARSGGSRRPSRSTTRVPWNPTRLIRARTANLTGDPWRPDRGRHRQGYGGTIRPVMRRARSRPKVSSGVAGPGRPRCRAEGSPKGRGLWLFGGCLPRPRGGAGGAACGARAGLGSGTGAGVEGRGASRRYIWRVRSRTWNAMS